MGDAAIDTDAVAEGLRAYFRRAPQWAKYSGVTIDANGAPNVESVKRAAQDNRAFPK